MAPESNTIESPLPKIDKDRAGPYRRIFVDWELLRILYNLILVGVVTVFVIWEGTHVLSDKRFWIYMVQSAVVANLCFFAGPLLESYLEFLGVRERISWLRSILFVAGTLLSIVLAVFVLAAVSFSMMEMG
ncbi:MAG: hypothetical protein ACR2NP_04210 [Pirellulaceae bacterium]